jgi:hypothetical protein
MMQGNPRSKTFARRVRELAILPATPCKARQGIILAIKRSIMEHGIIVFRSGTLSKANHKNKPGSLSTQHLTGIQDLEKGEFPCRSC